MMGVMNADSSQPSVMQFGMRGLIATVAVAAVIAAIAAPWVRMLDSEGRRKFAIHLSIYLAGFFAKLIDNCVRRYIVERRSTACYLILQPRKQAKRPWVRTAGAILLASALFGASIAVSTLSGPLRFWDLYLVLMCGVWSAAAIKRLWWNGLDRSFELCEQGIIMGGLALRKWSNFVSYRWAQSSHNLILQAKHQPTFVPVPLERHAEVDEIVRRFLPCTSSSKHATGK